MSPNPLLRPGVMVEVVSAAPYRARFVGERFVLTRRVHWYHEPAWETPFSQDGQRLVAEDRALKIVEDDGEFKRFMEKALRPIPKLTPLPA